jgi:hypothetical protein
LRSGGTNRKSVLSRSSCRGGPDPQGAAGPGGAGRPGFRPFSRREGRWRAIRPRRGEMAGHGRMQGGPARADRHPRHGPNVQSGAQARPAAQRKSREGVIRHTPVLRTAMAMAAAAPGRASFGRIRIRRLGDGRGGSYVTGFGPLGRRGRDFIRP